jgi:hypothetical protein
VWASGGDDGRTRTTHLAAEAQGAIPINATWNVGGFEMMHPGDFNAGPKEVANCRCSMLELYPGDVRPNGTIVPG